MCPLPECLLQMYQSTGVTVIKGVTINDDGNADQNPASAEQKGQQLLLRCFASRPLPFYSQPT